MNIYLFTVKDEFDGGYDSYSGHVIRAKNEMMARLMCPKGDEGNIWICIEPEGEKATCEILAYDVPGDSAIILSSFNAG